MRRYTGWIPGLIIIAAVLAAGMNPARAGGTNNNRRLTRQEVQKYWERVSKNRDWNEQQFGQVLRMCQYNKRLVDRFLGLTKKGFSPQTVRRSFAVTEGSKKLLDEFWKYVNKRRIPPAEVQLIFQQFPDNQIIRWKYVSWRRGGRLHKEDLREKLANKRDGRLRRAFPRKECLMVFRMTRFDVKLIDEYFTKRLKGTPPMKALQPIRKKMAKEMKEKQKEKKKEAAKKRKKWKKKWNKYREVLAESRGKTKKAKKGDKKAQKDAERAEEKKKTQQKEKSTSAEEKSSGDEGLNKFLVGDDKKDKNSKKKNK